MVAMGGMLFCHFFHIYVQILPSTENLSNIYAGCQQDARIIGIVEAIQVPLIHTTNCKPKHSSTACTRRSRDLLSHILQDELNSINNMFPSFIRHEPPGAITTHGAESQRLTRCDMGLHVAQWTQTVVAWVKFSVPPALVLNSAEATE